MNQNPDFEQLMQRVQSLEQELALCRQVQAECRDREERYRFLAENSSDVVLSSDAQGRYVYVSSSHKRLLGRGNEVLGCSIFDHIHPEDVPRVHSVFEHGLRSKEQAKAEYRYGHPSRGYIWLESVGQLHSLQSGEVQTVITSREITDRKQAEDALKASERKYRTYVDHSPVALFISDEEGRYVDVNNAACGMLGYTRAELLSMTIDMLDKTKEVETSAPDFVFFKEKGHLQAERSLLHKEGHLVEVILNAVALEDGLYMGYCQEISSMKQAAEENTHLQEQLRQSQKMEAIGRLAGGVAHDLNNMLTPILGFGEILRSDLAKDQDASEFVHEILNAGYKARDLVRQLLAFGRKQTLEYKAVNMNRVLTGLEKLLRRSILENIHLQLEQSPDVPLVMADIGQMEQVIMNLAVNAAESMSKGGSLTIRTEAAYVQDVSAIQDLDIEPGPYVLLLVSDTGCGMDTTTQAQIFEPFFSTKGRQGTGLGLATVYGIVKQHGGTIQVSSQPGEGTSFFVYLPVSDLEEEDGKRRSPQVMDLRGKETILLVEDNDQVRTLARRILRRHGYTVLEAENGSKALEVLRLCSIPVHLLLTDVIMPEVGGKELYVQARDICPELKVVYMSGYAEHGANLGEDGHRNLGFVHKPFTVHQLALQVRRVLEAQ